MADHLTPDQLSRYVKRTLSCDELAVTDSHLASCEECRQQASTSFGVDASYAFLRHDLRALAGLPPTHLTYEELEKYVDRQLDKADREIADSHLETCLACREELADLQNLHESLKTASAKEPEDQTRFDLAARADDADRSDERFDAADGDSGFWASVRGWLRKPIYSAGAAAVVAAAIVVAMIASHPRSTEPHPEIATQSPPVTSSAPTIPKSSLASKRLTLRTPDELASLIGKTETLLSPSSVNKSFELTEPVGTFVEDARPTFQWRPLSGADSYKVSVFDSALNEIVSGDAVSSTEWKSSVPFKRGVVYLWQVTALKDGKQVVSPAPPTPEARFEVLRLPDASHLAEMKRDAHGSHYELGLAYGEVGVLDLSEREFRLVTASDPNYGSAQDCIAQLERLRQHAVSKP